MGRWTISSTSPARRARPTTSPTRSRRSRSGRSAPTTRWAWPRPRTHGSCSRAPPSSTATLVLELAKEIITMVPGTRSTIVYEDLPQDDPKRRRPDITRARTLLGWEPTIDRADGLRRTLEYFRSVV